jgi:hypothetical protein
MTQVICKCGDLFPAARAALGYTTCLSCGDRQAKQVRHTVVPLNKSNYVVVSNPDELAWLNPKRIGG